MVLDPVPDHHVVFGHVMRWILLDANSMGQNGEKRARGVRAKRAQKSAKRAQKTANERKPKTCSIDF